MISHSKVAVLRDALGSIASIEVIELLEVFNKMEGYLAITCQLAISVIALYRLIKKDK